MNHWIRVIDFLVYQYFDSQVTKNCRPHTYIFYSEQLMLESLLKLTSSSMHERCLAVKKANNGHTEI